MEGPAITGGQRVLRGEARGEGYRVVTLVVVALVVCGALDVGVAVALATGGEHRASWLVRVMHSNAGDSGGASITPPRHRRIEVER